MSQRLQVLMDEKELRAVQKMARAERLSTAEWVRQTLRRALQNRPGVSAEKKLDAVRRAARQALPTGDIDTVLGEIERGYSVHTE